jgi:peptidoglycan/LPS O-acetylase OafA/YrhL
MTQPKNRVITEEVSILLDSIRLIAAVTVLIHHGMQQWLTMYTPLAIKMDKLAHAAVVVFFVLSGYLIAYTITCNNRGPKQYASARLSRLYSVVAPALVITALIQLIVSHYNPELAASYVRGNSWPRYLLCLFFINESGSLSAAPPINGPLWSLSYEFWYYAIFGIWFYKGNNWKSWLLLIVACCIAGPKILLLMPIWLLGFLAYRAPMPTFISRSWTIVFLLFFVAVCGALYLPALPHELGLKPFFLANQYIKDWIIGGLFAAALWLLPLGEAGKTSSFTKIWREIANLSFPLYILHYPLMVLWRAVIGSHHNDSAQMWQAIISVTIIAGAIGLVLEKYRGFWVRLFTIK